MAELQRQSSRRSTVDSEGEEVVVPGCFTKSVMRCPCAIMWGTFAVLQLPLHLRTRSHPTLTLNPHPHLPLAPTPPSTFTSTPRVQSLFEPNTANRNKIALQATPGEQPPPSSPPPPPSPRHPLPTLTFTPTPTPTTPPPPNPKNPHLQPHPHPHPQVAIVLSAIPLLSGAIKVDVSGSAGWSTDTIREER